jgi:hypothetical protein
VTVATPGDDAGAGAYAGWHRSRWPRGAWQQLCVGSTLDECYRRLMQVLPKTPW